MVSDCATKRLSQRSDKSGGGAQDVEAVPEVYKEASLCEVHDAPVAPDGGWGWVIVLSSFVCNFIVDGICYTFGVFLDSYVQYFNSGKGTVSWAGSLLAGVYLSCGPIVSALTNRYGCRTTCIVGSILGCISFVASTFSNSVTMLLITYGVCGGIGFGLIYLPAIVSVGYYFEKRRALATGIAVCGSGLGTFVLAPVASAMLSTYDWKGAHLILAGLILNCMVFGSLMRPLPAPKKGKSLPEPLAEDKAEEHKSLTEYSEMAVQQLDETCKKELGEPLNVDPENVMQNSRVNIDSTVVNEEEVIQNSQLEERNFQEIDNIAKEKPNLCSCVPDAVKSIVDFSLMKDPVFLLLGLSNVLGILGFYVPYIYIIDAAKIKGVSDTDAPLLISIIGIINIIGRLGVGWLSDFPFVDSLLVTNICILVSGAAVFAGALCTNYAGFCTVAAVFGLFSSAYIALTSIVLVDLVGIGQLSNAFGLLCFLRGISAIAGPPIAGSIFDYTQSYDISFYLGGMFLFASSLVGFLVPPVRRWTMRLRRESNTSSNIVEMEEIKYDGEMVRNSATQFAEE